MTDPNENKLNHTTDKQSAVLDHVLGQLVTQLPAKTPRGGGGGGGGEGEGKRPARKTRPTGYVCTRVYVCAVCVCVRETGRES